MSADDRRKISEAIELVQGYGQEDGAHHKMWVLDQVLRILMGEVAYAEFVREYENPPDEDHDFGEWDTGIAP